VGRSRTERPQRLGSQRAPEGQDRSSANATTTRPARQLERRGATPCPPKLLQGDSPPTSLQRTPVDSAPRLRIER
jgi:hypothetical protein